MKNLQTSFSSLRFSSLDFSQRRKSSKISVETHLQQLQQHHQQHHHHHIQDDRNHHNEIDDGETKKEKKEFQEFEGLDRISERESTTNGFPPFNARDRNSRTRDGYGSDGGGGGDDSGVLVSGNFHGGCVGGVRRNGVSGSGKFVGGSGKFVGGSGKFVGGSDKFVGNGVRKMRAYSLDISRPAGLKEMTSDPLEDKSRSLETAVEDVGVYEWHVERGRGGIGEGRGEGVGSEGKDQREGKGGEIDREGTERRMREKLERERNGNSVEEGKEKTRRRRSRLDRKVERLALVRSKEDGEGKEGKQGEEEREAEGKVGDEDDEGEELFIVDVDQQEESRKASRRKLKKWKNIKRKLSKTFRRR